MLVEEEWLQCMYYMSTRPCPKITKPSYRELAAFWTRHNGYIVASVEQEGQDVVYNHKILTSPHDWQTFPTMTD